MMSRLESAARQALEWIEDAAVVLGRTSTAIQGGIGAEAEGVGGCSVKVLKDLREALAEQAAEPVAYSIDKDQEGIRAKVCDAVSGALAYGALGLNPAPEGHWLEPFWKMARAERDTRDSTLQPKFWYDEVDAVLYGLNEDHPDGCILLCTPAPTQQPLTAADVRRAGGIVHSDGNVFFTNLDMLNKAIAGSQASTQQPVTDEQQDAARWRWLSEHITVAWDEGKFTSLVRIVSDKNRQALSASIDRMMAGDWSDTEAAHGITSKEGGAA